MIKLNLTISEKHEDECDYACSFCFSEDSENTKCPTAHALGLMMGYAIQASESHLVPEVGRLTVDAVIEGINDAYC